VNGALDSDLLGRLRDVLARGDTTEAELRGLTDEAADLVRGLRAQVRTSERRIRALNRDPASPIAEMAEELRRVETLRPQLREARELVAQLDARARELRTAWLLRQADLRRAP
jgi:predicted RNase H-like nuclease (RuvC/YqgF family)